VVESRLKESCDVHRSHHPNMHVIDRYLYSLEEDNKEFICY
jgi:hypothetical protein